MTKTFDIEITAYHFGKPYKIIKAYKSPSAAAMAWVDSKCWPAYSRYINSLISLGDMDPAKRVEYDRRKERMYKRALPIFKRMLA